MIKIDTLLIKTVNLVEYFANIPRVLKDTYFCTVQKAPCHAAGAKMKKPENNINLLSTAIDNAQFMLIIFDPELNTLQINEAFQKITGWTVESVEYTELLRACYPDPKLHDEVLEFMRREKQGWRKFQLTCKDGHIIETLWSCTITPDKIPIGIGIDITNEKLCFKTLEETEARYKAIFQATGTATLIVNKDTTIAMANQEAQNVTGYSPEQLAGHSWVEFVADESLELMRKYHQLRRKAPENAPKKYEVRLINKNGDSRHALLDIVMIPGSTQSVVSILDITDLKNSKELYQSLFNNIPLGVFRSTPDGRVISANPAMAEIYGYSTVEELLERPAQAYYKEDRVREQLLDILEKVGHVKGFETWEYKKDGTEIMVSTNYTAIKNSKGELLYIDGVVEDISERKLQEQEFRKLSIAVQQSPISIMITDTNGTIEYVNPQFLKLSGYSMRELIGENPKILSSGKTSKKEYDEIWKTITSGKTWHGEFLNRKKDGKLYWEDATIGPILDENGIIANFIGLKVDITTQKKALTELKDIHHIYQQTIENTSSVPYRRSYQSDSYEFVGGGIQNLLGLKPKEFTPKRAEKLIKTLIIADPVTDILDPMEYTRAFREGSVKRFKMDLELVLDSGEVKWVSNFATPLLDDRSHKVIGSMGILLDITDRKKTESELQYRLQLKKLFQVSQKCSSILMLRSLTGPSKRL